MNKLIRGGIVGILLIVLSGCGGSSSSDTSESENQSLKTVYKVKSDVIQYDANSDIKRVDQTTTFTAPASIGLSEGDVFIYENIAYKVSMIALDDTSNTVTIFTQKPTLDETIDDLEINGTIPFSAPKTNTSKKFKLNATVTKMKTSKQSNVTFECQVQSDAKDVSGGFSFSVTCTANSGDATITITSTETVTGGVVVDYDKHRDDTQNRIGFDVNIHTVSTLSGNYQVEIDNDQDPQKLFPTTTIVVGTTPITVSLDYFFLAGVNFDGSASYTRTDDYNYTRIYDFNFKEINTTQSANSSNNLDASVTIGAHVGLRPMVSIGVLYIDIAGLYVDAKLKEDIAVSGELSDTTYKMCSTSKIDFTLQAGYKFVGGDYNLLGEPYIYNLKNDTTDGCKPSYRIYWIEPETSCPARPYYASTKKSYKIVKNSKLAVSQSSKDVSDDDITNDLVNPETYERIIQIDKTGIGDKTISKVTWEVVDGDMDLKVTPLNNDSSMIMLSAVDEEGNQATLKATIHATDGTTLSQETSVVRNSKPIAVPKVYVSGNNLVLDASSSYDPDGNPIIGYGWYFIDTKKKIINRSAINKVPLSDLPNTINLRMAVASDNKPVELSDVESISIDISDVNSSSISDLIVGKTLYQNCDGHIESITFGTDGIITWIEDGHTETESYRIDGNTIYTNDGDGENVHILLESTDTYIKFDDGDGETTTFYFSEEDAKNAPADDCDEDGSLISNLVSGHVNFIDENGNAQSVPSNAWVRIVPSRYQIEGIYTGVNCKIDNNGNFGSECYIHRSESEMRDAFNDNSETFQVIVYAETTGDTRWYKGEDSYGFIGNDVSNGAWHNFEIVLHNTCTDQTDFSDIGSDHDALIYPNGGEIWEYGDNKTIRWMTTSIKGDTVDIYVLHDNPSNLHNYSSDLNNLLNNKNWYKFAEDISNNGTYTVDPKNLNGSGNAYVVLIIGSQDGWDVSDETFTLKSN